ncbi:MAG: hypothetical protein J6K12_01005 [Clostridia bacterium]|nr:hypothetical protein [Clostridia bacterium]
MKKTILRTLIVVFSIIVVFSLRFAYDHEVIRKEETEKYEKNSYDFFLLNNYVIENYDYLSESESGIIYTEDLRLPNDVRDAYNSVNAELASEFSLIYVTKERISYGGIGHNMYVYSRNGKKPTYFYHKGDGVIYDTYKLKDGWYLLRNIAR